MTVCMLLKRKSFMHKFMGHKKINHGHYNSANSGMLESFLLRYLYQGGKVEKANKCGF